MNAVDLYAEVLKILSTPLDNPAKAKKITKLIDVHVSGEFLKIIMEQKEKHDRECELRCDCEK
jgi:hypothetical protein